MENKELKGLQKENIELRKRIQVCIDLLVYNEIEQEKLCNQ